jgi:hypothetical protein
VIFCGHRYCCAYETIDFHESLSQSATKLGPDSADDLADFFFRKHLFNHSEKASINGFADDLAVSICVG